jgi:hypothetical protein
VIPVEEAIALRHGSSGFLIQHRALLGQNDRIMFPNGEDDVLQLALVLGSTPLYTWARHVKRIVDDSCASYPLDDALRSLHYFHQPTMFWVFEDPVLRVQPPADQAKVPPQAPAGIDAILITPHTKGPARRARDLAAEMMAQVRATPEERARISEELMGRVTGVMITAFSSQVTGQTVPLPIGTLPAGSRLCVPIMSSSCTFGQSASVRLDEIVDEQQTDPTIVEEQTRLRQWVLAAAALLKQRILVTTQQFATRGERKRLDRLSLATSVMTIQLRATEHTPSTSSGDVIEWSHRWIVRGHWRQQWYPSDKEHRVLWIPPYIKGPDDRPLQVRPAVYAVSR